jgi:arylformamidase
MVTWPGDPPVCVEPRLSIASGDACNVSELRLGSHTGTHVDSPHHFVDGGKKVDELPLETLMGRAWVQSIDSNAAIHGNDLQDHVPQGVVRLLLKTRNSDLWHRGVNQFTADFVALTVDAARWVVDQGIQLVGVDYLSIESPGSAGHMVHHILLEAGVIVAEGLDLSSLQTGWYNVYCLPLRVSGGDGAPARAVAEGPLA